MRLSAITAFMTSNSFNLVFMFSASTLFLSGCAASSEKYPSLAIRDFERAAENSVINESGSAPMLSAKLSAALQDARELAASRNADFNGALAGVRSKIAATRGSGPNSNAWGEAQIALADLSRHRSQTAVALGNIDMIVAEASADLVDVGHEQAIQSEVAAMLAQQDRALAQLRSIR